MEPIAILLPVAIAVVGYAIANEVVLGVRRDHTGTRHKRRLRRAILFGLLMESGLIFLLVNAI